MTFSHPYWLLGLLLWLLVPVLDRLAKPKSASALPLTHLGVRGLRRLPTSLPWLSGHGVAVMAIVLGLAGPIWHAGGPVRSEPGVAVVTVPGPDAISWQVGQRQYDKLVSRLRDRSALAISAYPAAPRLLVPWTERSEVLAGLWPAAALPVTRADAARAALMASAKAPEGAWLVVVGGDAGGRGWQAVRATLTQRRQQLAIIQSKHEALPFEPAFAAGLHDPDAVAALNYRLLGVTKDGRGDGERVPLGRWCLLAAVLVLVLNWGWRQGRWQVVAP
jgi:hypothetical protein